MSKKFQVSLPNRGQVSISGPDAGDFLQGLISNDISLVEEFPLVYSCLLSPQGKFHHDFFIRKDGEIYLLDCEGGERAENLAKRLKLFKLRSKVEFDVTPEIKIIAGTTQKPETAFVDPRLPDLGWRDYSGEIEGRDSFEAYDIHRLKLGVPDGSRDLVIDKSTLLESRLDKLNAVSFKKGCYMGQELTARMYYRGLAKKHLYPVEFSGEMNAGETIKTCGGRAAGEMRSHRAPYGLALLKDSEIGALSPDIKVILPDWMSR